jgi:hypothetical protein
MDILAVDAYSRVEICALIFLCGASKYVHIYNFWIANHLKKFKTQMDTSLNKAQHRQELLCR